MRNASPLRYPGGKWRFYPFFRQLISSNFDRPPIYLEPYAGGASLALSLLLADNVSTIYLNDMDPAIHAFWVSVIENNERFSDLIASTPVTPQEWVRQRDIYRLGLRAGELALGFATFFLNRTNHSGILNGGMIGGKEQNGDWRINARYNATELSCRIAQIAALKNRIRLSCMDALKFLQYHRRGKNKLIYLDPPYYTTGRDLYYNAYNPEDHVRVRDEVAKLPCHWLVSYDDVRPIRELYNGYRLRHILWPHSARTSRRGKELIYFSSGLSIPRACNRVLQNKRCP